MYNDYAKNVHVNNSAKNQTFVLYVNIPLNGSKMPK